MNFHIQYPSFVVITIYIILILCMIIMCINIITRMKYSDRQPSEQVKKPDPYGKNHVPFSLIDHQYFPPNIHFDNYCIYEDFLDLFNEYLIITIDTTQIIINAERTLSIMEEDIDNQEFNKNDQLEKFKHIESDIDKFIVRFSTFYSAVNMQHMKTEYSHTKVNLHPSRIQKYIDEVNMMTSLAENHLFMMFRLNIKIQANCPELNEIFQRISRKLIYIYYLNLFGATNILNNKLFGYNNSDNLSD